MIIKPQCQGLIIKPQCPSIPKIWKRQSRRCFKVHRGYHQGQGIERGRDNHQETEEGD